MTIASTDRIEKRVLLRAPRARVWEAIADAGAFGSWFGVQLAGPFVEGQRLSGRITHPGYEHVPFEITVERIEPQRHFSWRWHPNAIDPDADYSGEPTTLVVFELEEARDGTLLTVVESGFDGVPLARRMEAYRGNDDGWTQQMLAIVRFVGAGS